uniref:NADH dehydrogenase subunit 11 n=1 Tax=Rhodomonas salina TaxID=3034 RepID=Q9G8T0_RHDSA|nr:NADH dehydrogenase subunit 11 [Rhodomonas salina]AAG17767.1 NADH dehydrogenase subunit 11 [Rhodomonas salina]
MKLIDVFINDNPFKVSATASILESCNALGFEISRFCFHEKLFVAGNCRMCLVEIKNQPKLAASCAVFFNQGMSVYTNSPVVKRAKENVLEFLLINHPLDCPICDQGGECDLQDQSFFYGSDKSRFFEYKRAVANKNCGPLVKTIMNRCIQCTRCVRFANDVVGFSSLGTVGRGNQLEISFYIKKLFFSELSGNIIDICPVGALTAKPTAFLIRPWELKSVRSVDVFDGFGSNIRIDSRNLEILRILPFKNDFVNEEWISDKIRFGFDTLKRQRLNKPLLKLENNFFQVAWGEIFNTLVEKILICKKNNLDLNFCVGPFCDLKTVFFIKNLLKISNKFNSLLAFENYGLCELDFQHYYCFNNKFQILDNPSLTSCFLIGVDPKREVPILNLKLRKRYLKGNFFVANFGTRLNLTFPVFHLGLSCFNFFNLVSGNNSFCKILKRSKKKISIVGNSFFNVYSEKNHRFFISTFLKNSGLVNSEFFGLNILSNRAADGSLYALGLKTKNVNKISKPSILFIIGDTFFHKNNSKTFVCYQGIQGNELVSKADLILPSNAFTEKNALFVNLEGRFQNSQKSISSPKNTKSDFDIIFNVLGVFDADFDKKFKSNFLLKQNKIPFNKSETKPFFSHIVDGGYMAQTKIDNKTIVSIYNNNYYQTNMILKNSVTMAKSSKMLLLKSPFI